jgi:hypothetical protein
MAQDMGATVHADGIKFYEDTGNGTNYVGFNSDASLGGDQVWTLPTSDGSANQVLKTDGSGQLGWTANGRTPVTAVTATPTLTAADSGETFVFNDVDGATITLPDSGDGSLVGVYYKFFIAVSATSNAHKVVLTDTSNEKLYGQIISTDTDTADTSATFAAQAGDNFSAISSNGSTTGIIGSHYTITNLAADVWLVEGNIHCTGSPANPLAGS